MEDLDKILKKISKLLFDSVPKDKDCNVFKASKAIYNLSVSIYEFWSCYNEV